MAMIKKIKEMPLGAKFAAIVLLSLFVAVVIIEPIVLGLITIAMLFIWSIVRLMKYFFEGK